eukprot:scaffold14221_cov103-Cyclotella_meneghiniana.AAC.6
MINRTHEWAAATLLGLGGKCREQCRSHPAMTRNTGHRAVQRITVGIGVTTVSSDTVATELGLRQAERTSVEHQTALQLSRQ